MNTVQYNKLFNFIWNIANDVLVQVFEKGEYKKVIMPMLTLRRLDILLEPTKQQVLNQKAKLDKSGIVNQEPVLFAITKLPFCNTSHFTMKSLCSETDPMRQKMNFIDYLNGYSKDVQDIIDKFKLRQQVDNLADVGRLGAILEKFTDTSINLSIRPVLNEDGTEKLPALDNHMMGTLFEELLRKFNEENNVTEAGEHFTPRDYVTLLAELAVIPVADQLEDNTYSFYDAACGTGGILTISEDVVQHIAKERGLNIQTQIFGQENQPDTYATCKADLMVSGDRKTFSYSLGGVSRDRIAFGSTISQDGHIGETYDFCISNPPFGTPWKEDLRIWGIEKKDDINDPRFRFVWNDDVDFHVIPDIGDPQMLFLANNVSRMREDTVLGTRIVEVHNGSSLFTGGAGSGASNLRRFVIENDLLEAIIAMPENDFFNTGIGTYIWVLSNRKDARRRGRVQLIDATAIKHPLRKNLGQKNCETNEEDRERIMQLYMDFEENEQSRIFPNNEFGYWEVKVCRPLRLKAQVTNDRIASCISDKRFKELQNWLCCLGEETKGKEYLDFNKFLSIAKSTAKKVSLKWKKTYETALIQFFTDICEEAEIVKDDKGNPVPNKALEDTEMIPFRYQGGIDAFYEEEILPYTSDAWIDEESITVGYELSFTKYFYKPTELRPLADIAADIRGVEEKTKGMLDAILG